MLYVCSDIHGLWFRYEKLFSVISLRDSDTLFVLGDMIDRGPDGIRIIQDMMKRRNVVPFLGNHEMFLLCSLDEKRKAQNQSQWLHDYYTRNWLSANNGGRKTLKGLSDLDDDTQQELIHYLEGAFIQKNVEVSGKHYLLCHGSFWQAPTLDILEAQADFKWPQTLEDIRYDPETMLPAKPLHDLFSGAMWNSPYRSWDDEIVPITAFEHYAPTIFVIGHVPVQRRGTNTLYREANVIDIDGGCALAASNHDPDGTSSLICLRLDDEKVFQIQ